jgi:hypothetical protein
MTPRGTGWHGTGKRTIIQHNLVRAGQDRIIRLDSDEKQDASS